MELLLEYPNHHQRIKVLHNFLCPKPSRQYVKKLNCIYIHLWRDIFLQSWVWASSLISEKRQQVLLKLKTFFTSTTRDVYTKLLTFSESLVEVKMTFFVILIMSAVICKKDFCMKTRLSNIILKTTNVVLLQHHRNEHSFLCLPTSDRCNVSTSSRMPVLMIKYIMVSWVRVWCLRHKIWSLSLKPMLKRLLHSVFLV